MLGAHKNHRCLPLYPCPWVESHIAQLTGPWFRIRTSEQTWVQCRVWGCSSAAISGWTISTNQTMR